MIGHHLKQLLFGEFLFNLFLATLPQFVSLTTTDQFVRESQLIQTTCSASCYECPTFRCLGAILDQIKSQEIQCVKKGTKCYKAYVPPTHCGEVETSGVYNFRFDNDVAMDVNCLVDTDGRWTVIQSRVNGEVDFSKPFDSYRQFFGNLEGDFWLGNKHIHYLTTNQGQSRLRIDLDYCCTASNRDTVYYNTFIVDGLSDKHRLRVTGFEGSPTTGDAMEACNGMQFSAYDADNDMASQNCAVNHKGGWWYNHCYDANLNGVFGSDDDKGIIWETWKGNKLSLKSVKMMVKRP